MCMMIKLAIAIELPWGGDTFSRAGEDLDEDDAVLGHLLDPVVDMDGAHRLVAFRRSVLWPPGQCIPELNALCSSLLAREGSSLVTGRSNLFASVNC